jgi:small-conductance mechanosensitive channel/CRP-like cAMP-binding protein
MTNAAVFDLRVMSGALIDGGMTVTNAFVRILCLLVAYVVFSAAQRFWVKHSLLRSVSVQLNLLVLTLLALLCLGPLLSRIHPDVATGIGAAALFFGLMIGLKVVDVLVFDVMARWRQRPPAPLVVRDIGRLVISLLALVLIVRAFFPGVNLNVLAVSSLVVGYIVGNATQDTLGNLFAGLALNAEHPFYIGDWVLVAGHTGVIVDTTWRATRLKTKAEDYVVIPNAAIAKEPIINFSRPTNRHGCYLNVGVSYETPPIKAKDTILAVLAEIPDVVRQPSPAVYLTGYGDFSVNFTIKFLIEDYDKADVIESLVMERLWYGFKRTGISIPFPVRDVRMRDAGEAERMDQEESGRSTRVLLSGVDLFQTLSSAEFDQLVSGARRVVFARGEVLFRQGDPGETFYVIQSGRVTVSVMGGDGTEVPVAHLGAAAFFGEMSLLLGEPRSATITAEDDVEVLEISKGIFSGILKSNASLAEKLGVVLEKRVEIRQARLVADASASTAISSRSALVVRIRHFFGLG